MRCHGSASTVQDMNDGSRNRHPPSHHPPSHHRLRSGRLRSGRLALGTLWLGGLAMLTLLHATDTPSAVSATTGEAHARTAPPPVALPTRRSVTTRDANGGVQRLTLIPSASTFSRYSGGANAGCSLTADRDGFVLSTGKRVAAGTVVKSAYQFVEGAAVPFDLPPGQLPLDVLGLPSRGPLRSATRTFSVFCDRTYYSVNFRGLISVPYTDALFDPRTRIAALRNELRLVRPIVATPPVVDRYGGLVTRSPIWLAIRPEAWVTQRSRTVRYRGVSLTLVAAPRRLDMTVRFDPDPRRPSPSARVRVGCIPAIAATTGSATVPAAPLLPDRSRPGVGGPCRWTPPGPGVVTFTARVTYSIVFWVDGYTEVLDDYVWTSVPATFAVGELRAVNLVP